MNRMLPLAALALACVASPAYAAGLDPGLVGLKFDFRWAFIYLLGGAIGTVFALALVRSALDRSSTWADRAVYAVGVLLVLCVSSGALAAEVATVGDKAVILPWGDWLVALAVSLREPILTILIPIIAGYAIQAIRKVYPWAALFLSQRRVEMMLEAAVGYGLNAVNGAAKGKTLSVNVAVPVIAKGTQYVIDTAPPAVIKAAGGADGIAARIFRKLDLDDAASEANVLVPAQERIGTGTASADELRQMDEMVRR
ncbi:hypothetical protein [Methylorubrum thiocyanatum]|uniref:hypothetical protein n=1 Tax=Methylorubrum thiocyanatum TaxID=47958 RepID=UPI00365CC42B